jgi:hypothetical protein
MNNFITKTFVGKKKKVKNIEETTNVIVEDEKVEVKIVEKVKEKVEVNIIEKEKIVEKGTIKPKLHVKSELYNFLVSTNNIANVENNNIVSFSNNNIIIVNELLNFYISDLSPNTKYFISKNNGSRLNIYFNLIKIGTIFFEKYIFINFNFNRYFLFSPAIIYPTMVTKLCETVNNVVAAKIYTNKYYVATSNEVYIGNLLIGNSKIIKVPDIVDLWVNNYLYICSKNGIYIYDDKLEFIKKLEHGIKYYLKGDNFAICNSINIIIYENLEMKNIEFIKYNNMIDFCFYDKKLYMLFQDKVILNEKEMDIEDTYDKIIVKSDTVILWNSNKIIYIKLEEMKIINLLYIIETINNVYFDKNILMISTKGNVVSGNYLFIYKYDDHNFELIESNKFDINLGKILEFNDIIGLVNDEKCVYYIG